MLRVIKHIIVEATADRIARLERIQAAVHATFPSATTQIVPGLLEDDLVVEVRLPLDQLWAWPAARERWGDVGHPPEDGPASAKREAGSP